MSDTSMHEDAAQRSKAISGSEGMRRRRLPRKRLLRIFFAVVASVVVLAGITAGAGYLYINHLLDRIHRISGITALTAANQPVMPAATRGSMTVLLASTNAFAANAGEPPGAAEPASQRSNMIALVHLNANHKGGAVVAIPPTALVNVPGHGRIELHRALQFGGPSLLIRAVEQLTNVRIDHYSVVDLAGVGHLIDAMGGVDVTVPLPVTSYGIRFRAGINHLTTANALAYVRQPGASSIGRVELQQNLLRAMLHKMAQIHSLMGAIALDHSVLAALGDVLSVDSNFSDTQLESTALRLRNLDHDDGVFLIAPTLNGSPVSGGLGPLRLNVPLCDQLWQAIRHDAVTAFAGQHPATVTPAAPR